MNKKYLVTLLIFCLFFLFNVRKNKFAWAEDSITTSEKWQKLVEISERQQIPAEDLERILHVVKQAETVGFPVNPFLNKSLEGTAKQIPTQVILQVLEKRLKHFYTCQKILQEMPEIEKESASQRQQALSILAESMARGVSVKELKKLSKQAAKPYSVTLANASEDLATLKSLNFSAAEALEIVESGLTYGLYQKGGRKMSRTIQQARQKGISTQELKNHLLSNIHQGRGRQGIAPGKPNKGHTRQQPQGKRNKSKGGSSSHKNR